ncbi:MAG: BatA and WFA domain-containing protein [Ignavibacteriaceae bacterium]|nr:BatA and WFA domain-containing protein [Ignavibacteriaceae bacterium]
MVFLNPAVLFGLLAASIPVLIHLFNLRKLKKIEFSTLAFLKELQKNKIRKIKLKQWILLALRVLIVLFLITAFARPTLEGVAIGGTTSAAKTTAVFILDDTYSMSVVDGKGSYFNQAKGTIHELLRQLQEGDEAALVLVSSKNKEEIIPTSNLKEFSQAIDNIKISYTTGTLHSAIIKAGDILSRSKNFNKEIYLLSDFQSGSLGKENEYSDLGRLLNNKIKLYSFNYSGKEVYNIGIDDLKLNTQIFEKNKPVSFTATVTNYSKRPAQNIVISLFLNGERSAQQSVTLNEGESKIVNMEATPKHTGFVDVVAEIEDDEIMQDNKRYINMYIPKEVPLIIFTDNAKDIDFIQLALNASNESSALEITNKSLNQISSFNLSQYDAVILIPNGNIADPNRIKAYIQSGGGLLLFPGSTPNVQSFQNIAQSLNIPLPQGLSGKVNEDSNPVSFDNVEYNHPIFQNLFLKDDKRKIESPDIYAHYKITTQGRGENIITLLDGTSFLSEYKLGKGKIFLFNTSPVLSWSNFPLKSIFVPLMTKSVFYISSKDRNQNIFEAGENADINVAGGGALPIKIIRPDKSEEFIDRDKTESEYISYNKTDIAGNYHIISGDKLIEEISVNADPSESKTTYLTANEFKEYLKKINFKGRYIPVNKDENPVKIVLQSRYGSELWRYFAVIALLLALAEMTLARNTKKETGTV